MATKDFPADVPRTHIDEEGRVFDLKKVVRGSLEDSLLEEHRRDLHDATLHELAGVSRNQILRVVPESEILIKAIPVHERLAGIYVHVVADSQPIFGLEQVVRDQPYPQAAE